MPYTADKPELPETPDQLRARIPGWGVDRDPADRPSVPRERFAPEETGAHWEIPEQQPSSWDRERSIEHARLTPVFGTACPPKGVSGFVRRQAYARYSEARAAHWLLLMAADRIDATGSRLRSLVSRRPDHVLTETGLRSEIDGRGIASRFGRGRADVGHHALDPIVIGAPWLVGGYVGVRGTRRVARALARRR